MGYSCPPSTRWTRIRRSACSAIFELIEHLDRLGYDEAWIGEHHSGGFEIIASPELFIAAAAERTSQIRLGSGVISAPYHHPLHDRRENGAARSSDQGPGHVRLRTRPAQLGRADARHQGRDAARSHGRGDRRHHPAAGRRDRQREDRLVRAAQRADAARPVQGPPSAYRLHQHGHAQRRGAGGQIRAGHGVRRGGGAPPAIRRSTPTGGSPARRPRRPGGR